MEATRVRLRSRRTWWTVGILLAVVALVAVVAVVSSRSVPSGSARDLSAPQGAALSNTPPSIVSVTLAEPLASTGAVTGTITATDAEGDLLTYKATTSTKGTVTVTTDGILTYTPTSSARHAVAKHGATTASATDTVTLTVIDSKGSSSTKSVTVQVSPHNNAPVAVPTVGAPDPSTGVVTGTVSATDADRDPLVYSVPRTTDKGAVGIDFKSGSFTYTPTAAAREAAVEPGASAQKTADSFTVTVVDGYGGSTSVPVTVRIG